MIDKIRLKSRYPKPDNPYEIALKLCLERLLQFLQSKGQVGKQVHIVFECRGKDEAAELEFRRIVGNASAWGWTDRDFSVMDFVAKFAKKSVNSTGLQLVNLTARPIALSRMRPEQPNRAYDVILTKLGHVKVFP